MEQHTCGQAACKNARRQRVAVAAGMRPEPWHERAMAALRRASATGGFELSLNPNAQAIDVVVELAPQKGASTAVARLYIEDEHGLGADQIGAEAVRAGRRSVVVRLIRAGRDGSRTAVAEGALPVVPWSFGATRRTLLDAVADWPARLLMGHTSLSPAYAAINTASATRSMRTRPRWAAEVGNLFREMARAALDEQWAIGVLDAPAAALLRGIPPERVRWLDPLPRGFLADPMALTDGSTTPSLLAEAYWFGERRGKIVALTSGQVSKGCAIVLDRPWHLSYPFLWREGSRIWCLPEMAEAGRVQLFRADPFPYRWVEGPVLLENFAGIDATLHHDGTRYWLFAGNLTEMPNGKLFLFHSERLETGWEPHPWNPVRCDLRNGRPAGPLFEHEGALFRPAQDCSDTYGGALVLNRIVELSPHAFREEAFVRLAPDPKGPYPDGLHTFCAAGPVTIIDGKRHFPSLSRLLARMRKLLHRR